MRDSIGALLAIWLTVLVVAAALLAATGYRTRDPDSRAYITITTHLVDEPVSRWLAPQWWGAFGLQGLFRDHPAGTFVPPALLAKAGYPVAQSLFVVTLACQIIVLLLMSALASRFTTAAQARALVWVLQLIPIAFVFRVRGNQEYPLLAGLLLAVYGIERARTGWAWIAVAVVGALYALVVKGVFALLAPVLTGLWLWSRRREGSDGAGGWLGFTLILVLMPLSAWAYEHAYQAVTGQSFLEYYLGARIALTGNATSRAFAWTRWPTPFGMSGAACGTPPRGVWSPLPLSLPA